VKRKMEDASALYAAQRFARRLNTGRDAVRLCGADHERVTITALLRSTCEGLRPALRGDGEAGLLLGVSSTEVLLDGVPLQKRPTNRSFASRVHFGLAAERTSDIVVRPPRTEGLAFPFGSEG
jgi:hypothetical protein